MPDEIVDDKAGAEAGTTGEAAPEVDSQSQTSAVPVDGSTAAPSWQFGGNTYSDPNKLYEAARKWESENTRKWQERAQKDKETTGRMGQMESIINAIRGDEALRQQVIQRMQAGQTQQQAVQGVATQLPPEVLKKLETVDYLESRERDREHDAAIDTFAKSHKEMGEKDWESISGWLEKNEEWAGKLEPHRQLALAYAEVVVPTLSARFQQMGQQQKEDEIKKGGKSAFLGSQAPTAGAKPAATPERKRGMSPSEEREYALKVFRAAGQKK